MIHFIIIALTQFLFISYQKRTKEIDENDDIFSKVSFSREHDD